ncbi:MAG: cell envelope integrity protein TolA [Pseudomonadales bacterium]|nr:cell envelope integrity protein TolA [Pseudomonadales bacterium]
MIDLEKTFAKPSSDDYFIPLVCSFLLHTIILLLIAFGWEASAARPPVKQPDYIKAKLVKVEAPKPKSEDKNPLKAPKPIPVADIEKIKAEQKKREAEKKLADEKKLAEKRAAEQKAAEAKKAEEAKKLAAAKKAEAEKKLADEKKAAEIARQKKALEAQQLKEKQQHEKQLKERQQQEALARAEAKRKAEDELLLAMQQEENFRQQQRDEEIAQDYASLIRQRVEQQWSRPPSARRGMEVLLEITLVPTGYIVNVAILKGSGNRAFDLSAEQAVRKVEKFEELKNMPASVFEAQFRQFRLLFKPEDKPS